MKLVISKQQDDGMHRLHFTDEELHVIRHCNTPDKVQDFLNQLDYNFDEERETHRTFRGVLQHRTAHCLEGMITAAAILSQHGYPPLTICLEASDIDHNIFVYWHEGHVGSIAKSRQVELHGRPPIFKTYRDLVMSYYPDYYNWFTRDRADITMRGWALTDLRIFSQNWITGSSMQFIEEYLYTIPYKQVFPEDRDVFYYSRKNDIVTPVP